MAQADFDEKRGYSIENDVFHRGNLLDNTRPSLRPNRVLSALLRLLPHEYLTGILRLTLPLDTAKDQASHQNLVISDGPIKKGAPRGAFFAVVVVILSAPRIGVFSAKSNPGTRKRIFSSLPTKFPVGALSLPAGCLN